MMNQNKRQKVKDLLARLNTLSDMLGSSSVAPVNLEMVTTRTDLNVRPVLQALKKLEKGLGELGKEKDTDVKSILKTIEDADTQNTTRLDELTVDFKEQVNSILQEVQMSEERGTQMTAAEIKNVLDQVSSLQEVYDSEKEGILNKSALLESEVARLGQDIASINRKLGTKKDEGTQRTLSQNVEDTKKARKIADEAKEAVDDLRKRVNSRLASLSQQGGGNANRNIAVGGNTSVLSTFTDINLKAGSNVTLTYSNNQTTKYLDLTIASSGGGGGTVRSINNIAVDTTAGATAGTDYVYLVSGTTTLTLPTAVANTNLYTIKNVGVGVVTIATTGGQTIDADTTVVMPVQYTSVDLISDGSNWKIT